MAATPSVSSWSSKPLRTLVLLLLLALVDPFAAQESAILEINFVAAAGPVPVGGYLQITTLLRNNASASAIVTLSVTCSDSIIILPTATLLSPGCTSPVAVPPFPAGSVVGGSYPGCDPKLLGLLDFAVTPPTYPNAVSADGHTALWRGIIVPPTALASGGELAALSFIALVNYYQPIICLATATLSPLSPNSATYLANSVVGVDGVVHNYVKEGLVYTNVLPPPPSPPSLPGSIPGSAGPPGNPGALGALAPPSGVTVIIIAVFVPIPVTARPCTPGVFLSITRFNSSYLIGNTTICNTTRELLQTNTTTCVTGGANVAVNTTTTTLTTCAPVDVLQTPPPPQISRPPTPPSVQAPPLTPTPSQNLPSTPPPSTSTLLVNSISYSASSRLLSDRRVMTTVASDGNHVLTVDFFTDSATADFTLPNGTRLQTLPIPQLLGTVISQPVVDAMGTAAIYAATQIVNALTLSGGKRKLLRVLLDSPGCDFFLDTACTIPCCAKHDQCYRDNECSFLSWIDPLSTFACDFCNAKVVGCVFQSAFLTCDQCANDTPKDTSCYDHTCDKYYDCKGACPCLTLSTPPEGCCTCTSPCQTPTPTPTWNPSSPTPTPTPTSTPLPTLTPTPTRNPSLPTPTPTPTSKCLPPQNPTPRTQDCAAMGYYFQSIWGICGKLCVGCCGVGSDTGGKGCLEEEKCLLPARYDRTLPGA